MQKPRYPSEALARAEALRCLLCHDSPCRCGCPAGIDPRAFIRKIRFGNLAGAARALRRGNILYGISGYICPSGRNCVARCTSEQLDRPIDILGLSNGARTGLTGFVAGLARQSRLASANVTINNLLPGPFDTDRLRNTMLGAAKASGQPVEQLLEQRRKLNPTQRYGNAAEFGAVCAFLCSVHAGYMTGQNILLDGGAFPGTF